MKAAPNIDLNDIITELDELNIKVTECNTTQIREIRKVDNINNDILEEIHQKDNFDTMLRMSGIWQRWSDLLQPAEVC